MTLFVQNEATAARRRFPIYLVNATDGLTAVTTEAGGQPQISKAGAAFGNTTATLTAIGNGSYYVELTATELNTLGMITVRYKSANTAEFSLSADVIAMNVHDTVRAGLTALPNAAAEAAGGLYTRGAGAGQINQDANGRVDTRTAAMAADVLTAAATAADFSTEVNAAILAVLGALTDAAGSGDPTTTRTLTAYLKQLVNTLEGTAGIPTWAAAAAPANAVSLAEAIRQIYTDVGTRATAAALATVQADTDDIQTRLPAALVAGRMDSSVGAMAANVMTAAAADPTLANEVADQVWDEVLSGHLTAGTTGAALNGAGSAGDPWTTPLPGAYGAGTAGNIVGSRVDVAVSTRSSQASNDAIQADTDNLQTRLPAALVGGRIDASIGAVAANAITGAALDPTAGAELADAVWDELLAAHAGAGSAGAALAGAGGGGGTDPWLTALPGAYGVGTAGAILGTNLNAQVSSRATPAQVNAEVVDAISIDTYAEPGQVAPPATASLVAKIGYLYKLARNRVTSSTTEIAVYNAGGSAIDHKATHADGAGVYDRGEFGSGP